MDSHELRIIHNSVAAQGLASDCLQFAGEDFVSGVSTADRSNFLFKGDVDHVQLLSSQLSNLLKTCDFADVTFVVESEKFMCHRIILSSRCEYFRALLFGGMREAFSRDEIILRDTPVCAFKVLLQYLYSGAVSLKSLKEDDVIDLLGLAHKYGLLALQSAIGSYLEGIVNAKNVTVIFDVSCLYQLNRVRDKCLSFMDHNALEVLDSEGFVTLSEAALLSIIRRDSFCAGEFRIFVAVCKWIEANKEEDKDVTTILGCIRLPLISLHDLFHGVRLSSLYSSDVILDAIQMKTECKVNDMPFRGHLGVT